MTPRNAIRSTLIAAVLSTLPLTITACAKEEPPPPPPPPPVDTGPDWTLDDINIDPRVQFPDKYTPSSQDVAQAIADLAAALINGEASNMRQRLATGTAGALDMLIAEGMWDSATDQGRIVRIVNILEEEGTTLVALGWESTNTAFPIAFATTDSTGDVTFTPYAIKERFEQRAAALDGIPFDPPEFAEGSGGTIGGTRPPTRPSNNNNDGDRDRDRQPSGPSGPSPGFG